jgi:hypothetical protein
MHLDPIVRWDWGPTIQQHKAEFFDQFGSERLAHFMFEVQTELNLITTKIGSPTRRLTTTQEAILKLLRNPGHWTARSIGTKLHIIKPLVNRELYRFLMDGIVCKHHGTPPRWTPGIALKRIM